MSLLRAVILRACAPFLFILAVKWIQESNLGEHGTQFCALITFIFYCILTVSKQVNKQTNMVYTTAISILFSSSVYAHMQNITEKDKLIIYHALAFIDYRAVFQTCMDTTKVAATLLWWLYCKVNIRPYQKFMHITWLVSHSIMLLWILDSVIIFTVRTTIGLAASNCRIGYSTNLTQDYSEGYLQPRLLERKIKLPINADEYIARREQTQFVGSFPLIELSHLPLRHISIERYFGEDVKFDCSHRNRYPAANMSLRWLHNNATLRTSTRHKISKTTDSKTADVIYKYHITSVLYIERLQEGDFGEYECVSEQPLKVLQTFYILKPILFVYRLNCLKFKPRIIYRSIGSLIESHNVFLYNTDSDLTDVSLQYTVNNQLLENVCPGIDIYSCSAAARFLSSMYNLGLPTNIDWDDASPFPYLDVKERNETSIKRAVTYFCICDKAFGFHKVSFVRRVLNEKTLSYQMEEYEHPLIFIILPDGGASFFRWKDDTDTYKKLADYIDKEDNWQKIEEEILKVVDYIGIAERNVLLIINLYQSLIALLGLGIYFSIFTYMLTWYYSFVLNIRTINFMASLDIQCQLPLAIADIDPCVFISHSDDQNAFVIGCLLPYIEQYCHRKAISSDRDCIPGSSIFQSHSQNIKQSKQIIIVLSESYMKQPECYKLQLEHLIMPLLYEDKIPVKDVLIIKYNCQYQLPQHLRWNLELSVLAWMDTRDRGQQLRRIQKWIAKGSV